MSGPLVTSTPRPLGIGAAPVTSVPMKFPRTKLPIDVLLVPTPQLPMWTPISMLPEMTLRSAGVVPPMRPVALPPLHPNDW